MDGRERCVYVGQREMAVASAEDAAGVQLLGSEDATTCHVLVLRDTASRARVTGLAHVDSEDAEQLLALERAVRQRSGWVATSSWTGHRCTSSSQDSLLLCIFVLH